MIVRTAAASWEGDLKSGHGRFSAGSGRFEGEYSFATRFEEDKPGTNPEELIGAAHAACFSMALAGALSAAGHSPRAVRTDARVHLTKEASGYRISAIDLATHGDVPKIDQATFARYAEEAKATCPVSKLLTGATIRLQAELTKS